MENIKIQDNSVILTINPKIYALEIVYSAAYVFLDKAYILLDGDPKKEIIVRLIPKEKQELNKLGMDFFNELINYGDYSNRAKQTKTIRDALLQRALISVDPSIINTDSKENDEEFEKLLEELEKDDEFLDDPEGIAIPWEEKYGKESKTKKTDKKKNAKKTDNKTKR